MPSASASAPTLVDRRQNPAEKVSSLASSEQSALARVRFVVSCGSVMMITMLFVAMRFDVSVVEHATSYLVRREVINATLTTTTTTTTTETTSAIDENDDDAQTPTAAELLRRFREARKEVEDRLRRDYGDDNYDVLFVPSDPRALSVNWDVSDDSRAILRRRVARRVIEAHVPGLSSSSSSSFPTENDANSSSRFVWATGGHSAAAGHGNLFNQSYTAVLTDTVDGPFAALGIRFEGRNRAMGGFQSGPELACCVREIYGADVDVLSWEFGMTDGRSRANPTLWAHRAAATRPDDPPALFFKSPPSGSNHRFYQTFETALGVAVASEDTARTRRTERRLPDFAGWVDAERGGSPEEVVPPAARYYRCGAAVEAGDPCEKHKWDTKRYCGPRTRVAKQTSWHPGWKAHAAAGRTLGLLLLRITEEALESLLPEKGEEQKEDSSTNTVVPGLTREYHEHLRSFDVERRKQIRRSSSSSSLPTKRYVSDSKYDDDHDLDNEILYHGRSVCHTALLPSASRHENLSTNNQQRPLTTNDGDDANLEFYRGYAKKSVPDVLDVAEPVLVREEDAVLRCDGVPLLLDYKDHFLVRQRDGPSTVRVPNDAEAERYRPVPSPWDDDDDDASSTDGAGAVMVCQFYCPWGKCDAKAVQLSTLSFNADEWPYNDTHPAPVAVRVNGERVARTRRVAEFCYLLENERGSTLWNETTSNNTTTTTTRRYDLTFEVATPGRFLQISSIVVWW